MATSALYSYITFGDAKNVLAARINDPSKTFWTDAELGAYLIEALRTWNAMTATWVNDMAFTVAANSLDWLDLGTMDKSLRKRTVKDSDLYTMIEYHLLEPPTGATWQGTSQFNINDIADAMQRSRDEILQAGALNVQRLAAIPVPPNVLRTALPDNVLEIRRARYRAVIPANSPAVTLRRSDPQSLQIYSPTDALTVQNPDRYSSTHQLPLFLDLNSPPPGPGTLDLLAVVSGADLVPPANTLLEIPDDWTWVLKWGTMADMLTGSSEPVDVFRAAYCAARYKEGLILIQNLPWLITAKINDQPVGIESVTEMDNYAVNWDNDPAAYPALVEAGTDLIAITPKPTGNITKGVTLRLVQSAPIPADDAAFLQLSRDVLDTVMDYSCHLAAFKMGGSEFMATIAQYKGFLESAATTNSRFAELSIFADKLQKQGRREENRFPRFKTDITAGGV